MEKTIQTGKKSIKSLLTIKNLLLGGITCGIWLIIPLLQLFTWSYELTNERIIITKGLITKTENQIDLYKVKDIKIKASGILKIGVIEIHSGDPSHPVTILKDVDQPKQLGEKIRAHAKAAKSDKNINLIENI